MFLQAHALSKVHDLNWIARMILPRAHLWKPCYNFSFQRNIQNLSTVSVRIIHWITGTGTGTSMEILVLGTARRASGAHSSAEQGCFRFPLPLPPTISVGGSGSFRCFRFPLRLPPTASAFRCFRLPLPSSHYLSGRLRLLPLLPLSAVLASHNLSGRLKPSAASAFRCPCLPLSQWEARAPSALEPESP